MGGGDASGNDLEVDPAPYCHRIALRRMYVNNKTYIVVFLRLFGQMGLPGYHIIVQERPANEVPMRQDGLGA